ncbi:MAG TPA: PBP1A family penicillin-binding protein [Gaiellaceae bacterium]|jgi:penicillin-binding protein 1A
MAAKKNGNGNGRTNGNGKKNGNGHGRKGAAVYANHRRRDRNRRRRERAAHKRLVVLVTLLVLVGLLAALAAAAFTGATAFRNSCDLGSLRPVSIGQNTFVYAADGSMLGSIPADKNRQPLQFREMSHWVRDATVAVEDKRFWDHGGLDYEGIIRAAVKNLEEGHIVEGGSTITQQLVRNLYIGQERSFERKIKEACLALKLNDAWSKQRILQTYLNQVPYGNHAYGVEAAAQTYFSRHAKKLTLTQAALIAGLPQAPSAYDPFVRPDAAKARRNEVLRAMLEDGEISQTEYDKAVARPLGLKRGSIYTKIREPFFFGYVRDELVKKYGVSAVRSGGLKVYTTIDPRFQRLAKASIRSNLYLKTDPAAALVSINPANGAIRAMAAVAPGREGLQFNLAAQGRRQAGSSFKTFVLTEAMKEGINPDSTRYLSAPFTWQPDPNSAAWNVKTYDDSYYGVSTIRQATLRSDNTVYARLTLDVGPENVVKTAHEMGIKTHLEPVASVGLGSNSVSVLEMASGYATLAAGGIYSKPMAIRKVVLPSGRVDPAWGKPKRKRVLKDGVAYEVTQILEENMQAGTATAANPGRPAAGKTGTTDNFADAWLCGFTPNLATAVWVGYPNAQIEMRSVHGISVAGGTFPAMIWHDFVVPALASTPPLSFPLPSQPIVWQPFHGQYAFYGPPPGSGDKKNKKKDKDKGDTESSPTTTGQGTTTQAPPTTTAPPPTTTGGDG